MEENLVQCQDFIADHIDISWLWKIRLKLQDFMHSQVNMSRFSEADLAYLSGFKTTGFTHLLCLLQVISRWRGDFLADDNVIPVNPVTNEPLWIADQSVMSVKSKASKNLCHLDFLAEGSLPSSPPFLLLSPAPLACGTTCTKTYFPPDYWRRRK